jgi:hypothetical protein
MDSPETRYAKSGDVDIAYSVSGVGPIDLVWVQGYVNNVELHWEIREAQRFISRLSSFCRLIRFDRRGTGLVCPIKCICIAPHEQLQHSAA